MGGHQTGWKLAGFALAWLAGVALHLQERSVMATAVYAACAAIGMCGVAASWRWRRAWVAGLVGIAAIGFGTSGWRADERLAEGLPHTLEGRDIEVVGVVGSLPHRTSAGLSFRLEVESAQVSGGAVALPPLLALSWTNGFGDDAVVTQPQHEVRAGQRWRLVVRLRQPHGNMNPHGYDSELAAFEQGVGAVGTVRDAPSRMLDRAAGHPVERLRQHVRDAIDAAVADRRAAGVLAALSVGDQSAIERSDWDLFRNAGIAHLVSISGLHITMFAWLAGLLIASLWRRNERLALALPAALAARWGGWVAALAYAVFSGWGVPSQRTVWMLATVTLLTSMGRRWPWPLVLLAAAMVVSLLDPWALLQAGFWLSFVAVGLLMASGVAHGESPGTSTSGVPATGWRRSLRSIGTHMRGELRSQVIATVGLTPLTLLFFQQISLVGFVANLVAIPVVTLVITPLALLGAAFTPLWWLGAWCVQQLSALLAWLVTLPGAVWSVPVAPAWAQACGVIGAALMIVPIPWRLRLLAIPLVLPMLVPPVGRPRPDEFEVVAVDIGQGTSVLVRTRSHLLVFDAGPQYSRDSDAGQREVLPLLRARGETHIDMLMLSHRDADHVGGAGALLGGGEVGVLRSSIEDGHRLRALAKQHDRCVAGQSWQWDGVRFDVLQPPAGAYDLKLKSNAMSCVLRVSTPSASVLLTGDIEREQEAALVSAQPAALASDVLIVPHHGSRTSSTEAFIDAVKPRFAIFQAGYRNRFGHPLPDVMARYVDRRIVTLTSPACGAWTWQSVRPQEGVCERDAVRRYWHHRAE